MELGLLAEFCARHGYSLSSAQLDQFRGFQRALYGANQVMNLTRVPAEECEVRHFIDSLLIIDLILPGTSVLDIGTGPGLPAWPLAAARPDVIVTGLDSAGKMINFLQRQHLPNLKTKLGRVEDDSDLNELFDVVTGRALAPLAAQLEVSARPCRVGGRVIPMRTPLEREAIEAFPADELGLKLIALESRELPGTDVIRLIPIFEKVAPTPMLYPRMWADIKRKPIGGA